jgi:hypothetical protein
MLDDEKGDFVGTAVREVSLFNECILFVCLCCPAYVWFCLSCQKPQLQVFFHMSETVVYFFMKTIVYFYGWKKQHSLLKLLCEFDF